MTENEHVFCILKSLDWPSGTSYTLLLNKKKAYMLRHHGNHWWMKVSTHLPISVCVCGEWGGAWQHKNPVRVCLRMWRSPCLWMWKTSLTKNKVGGNASLILWNQDLAVTSIEQNRQRSRFVPEKMQEGNELKQSSASSSRGNRKKAGRARFGKLHPWNNKNLTLTGNGSASKTAWQVLLKGSSSDPGWSKSRRVTLPNNKCSNVFGRGFKSIFMLARCHYLWFTVGCTINQERSSTSSQTSPAPESVKMNRK